MLKAVLVGSDNFRLQLMQHALVKTEKLLLVRAFDRYPPAFELVRALTTFACDVLILDLDDREHALRVAVQVHAACHQVPIIAVTVNLTEFFDVASTGIVGTLTYPPTPADLIASIRSALHAVNGSMQSNLFVFLPAKAGSGCSAVVLNTAAALLNPLGRRVLVMEADLRSGVLSIALNHNTGGAIQDALACSQEMDSFKWDRCLTQLHGIHFLLSNRTSPRQLPDWADYYALLRFAAPRYDTILVDLPELVNPGTAEIVRKAQLVFLVSTQEVLALKLAEQRCLELTGWGVPPENIRILINRWHNHELSRDDVKQLLNHPVTATFPNDYPGLRKSLLEGRPVRPDTKLGKAFLQFARELIPAAPDEAFVRNPFRSFIRSFSKS